MIQRLWFQLGGAGGGGGGGGGAGGERSRKVWAEVCRRALQTLILFHTKTVHFATLFKTRDLIS